MECTSLVDVGQRYSYYYGTFLSMYIIRYQYIPIIITHFILFYFLLWQYNSKYNVCVTVGGGDGGGGDGSGGGECKCKCECECECECECMNIHNDETKMSCTTTASSDYENEYSYNYSHINNNNIYAIYISYIQKGYRRWINMLWWYLKDK